MDDLRRSAFIRDNGYAACNLAPDCPWKCHKGAPATIAAKARKHTRETGHPVHIIETRVTSYRPREGAP